MNDIPDPLFDDNNLISDKVTTCPWLFIIAPFFINLALCMALVAYQRWYLETQFSVCYFMPFESKPRPIRDTDTFKGLEVNDEQLKKIFENFPAYPEKRNRWLEESSFEELDTDSLVKNSSSIELDVTAQEHNPLIQKPLVFKFPKLISYNDEKQVNQQLKSCRYTEST